MHLSKDFNWLQLNFTKNFFFTDELVVFVVLTVPVVSGVQHVDCVTFSTLSFFLNEICNKGKRKKKRNGRRERERERKRERERGR